MADIYAVSDTFRRRMLAREADAARQMIEAYARLDRQLRSDITALAELLQARRRDGAVITEDSLRRMERYRILQAQIAEEMQRLSILAEGLIAGGQAVAVDLGQESALRTTLAALPPGTTERLLADAGLAWNRLPTGALERMVGFAGDGSPLRALLDQIGPDVSRGVLDTLVEAVGRGYAPGKTAELVQQRVGMGLTRALRISRTEQLRAFRTASLDTYKANPRLVKGWRWVAAHSARTCAACLAMDGKEFEMEEPQRFHVACRCSIVPRTVSWRELGIPIDEPARTRPTGEEWFAAQPAAVQQRMLGPTLYEAYQVRGSLQEFYSIHRDAVWGESVRVRPGRDFT